MFFKEVYRHSRWMFAGMLFFTAMQLLINYKGGMVFSPFYHYGMYGWPQKAPPVYQVHIITLNGDTLRGKDFSPEQWDKIHVTLQAVLASSCDSIFFAAQVARLYKKAGIEKAPDGSHFINSGTRQQKLERYKRWLAGQLGHPGANIEVHQAAYRYHHNRLAHPTPSDIMTQIYPCN